MSLETLISQIEPHQETFVSHELREPQVIIDKTKNKAPPDPMRQLVELPDSDFQTHMVGRQNSLYYSFLILVDPGFRTSLNQRKAVSDFIDSLMSKLDTDPSINRLIEGVSLTTTILRMLIKDTDRHAPEVFWYLSAVSNLNLVVVSELDKDIKLYCKGDAHSISHSHLIFYQDPNGVVHPVFYGDVNDSQQLSFTNELVNYLINQASQLICKKTYLKKPVVNRHLAKLKVAELRQMAVEKGIEIKKFSKVSGKQIYKKKEELIAELVGET